MENRHYTEYIGGRAVQLNDGGGLLLLVDTWIAWNYNSNGLSATTLRRPLFLFIMFTVLLCCGALYEPRRLSYRGRSSDHWHGTGARTAIPSIRPEWSSRGRKQHNNRDDSPS